MYSSIKNKGFGIIEVVVAVAIIAGSLFALANAALIAGRLVDESVHKEQAAFLLEEGFEVIKIIRDGSWSSIASTPLDTPQHFIFSGGVWQLTLTPQTIDGRFTRTATFSSLFRDNITDNIVLLGCSDCTEDTNARRVIIDVTWDERGAARTIEANSYVTNLFE